MSVNVRTETAAEPRRAATTPAALVVRQPAGTENLKPVPRRMRVESAFRCVAPPQAERMKRRTRGRTAFASKRKDPREMAKTKDKVSDAAGNVKPYVERALHDEELRDSVRNAYESARTVYNELIGRRGVTGVATRIATDKDIQDELRATIAELRKAADRVQGREEHKSRNGGLLFVGIVLGILFNPVTGGATRKWLSDRLLGGSG